MSFLFEFQRRELQAERRQAAMEIQQPKAAPVVRMEELRAMNMIRLDDSDLRARYELAQKPKPIVPSGGFTGFRWASNFPPTTKTERGKQKQ